MMTERRVAGLLECLCMSLDIDYIPYELQEDAAWLLIEIGDDVELYGQFEKLGAIEKNAEADKFCVWWDMRLFLEHPHSLIILYENIKRIDLEIGQYDVLDGINRLQLKLVKLYRLMKENEMIE